jgi:hypothetical protein
MTISVIFGSLSEVDLDRAIRAAAEEEKQIY